MALGGRGARLAVVGLSLALASVGCQGGTSKPTVAQDSVSASTLRGRTGGTVNILMAAPFAHLDPQRIYVPSAMDFSRLYARTLTTYQPAPGGGADGGKVVPDLATTLGTPSDNAKTWRFTLKTGLRFQDGSQITSRDVRYGVERSFAANLAEGAPYARQYLDCRGYKGPYLDRTGRGCAAIETPDDKTVIFHLNLSVGNFPYLAALPIFSPVPKAKDTGPGYDNQPFSSGPYKFQSARRGGSIVLVRNHQWDARTDDVRPAYPDGFRVTASLNPAVIDQRLIANAGPDQTAIMLGDSVAPQDLARVLLDPAVMSRSDAGFDSCNRYLALNTKKAPLDQVKVRQAINYAVDKEAYRTALGGRFVGDFASTIVAPSLVGHRDFDTYKAAPTGDVGRAKQLLNEAGLSGGFTVRLATIDKGRGLSTAVAIQQALGRVGIKVGFDPVQASDYYARVGTTAREPQLVLYGWCPDFPSAGAVLPFLFDGRTISPQGNINVSQYDNAGVNARLDEIARMTDPKEIAAAYGDLDEKIMKDAPIVPLLNTRSRVLHGSKVSGAYFSAALGGGYDVVTLSVA